MAVGIEFVFYKVEMARFLVVFLKFRKEAGKVLRLNGETRYDFQESIYFVTDGSFTADGGLL